MDTKTELDSIKKEIVRINILGAPGAIMLGIGLYALFGAEGEPFHPLLKNASFVLMLLVAGGAIEVWQLMKLMPLFKKHAVLAKKENT